MINDPGHIDHNVLVLYLLDELPSEDKPVVEDWINSSESNQKLFSELKKTWTETGKIAPMPVVVNVDQAWNKLKSRIREEDAIPDFKLTTDTKVRSLRGRMFVVAAAAIVILGALSVVFSDWFKRSVDPIPVTIESFAEVILDTLDDGSSFALNEGSKIIYQDAKKESKRKVELAGEAFFEVKRDSLKPFVIDAGLGAIEVLGTQFNVKAYAESDLEVFVESGLVKLSLKDSLGEITKSILLNAGEKGVISYREGRLFKTGDQLPDELYWANRKLIFRDTELFKVFEILADYYDFEVKTEHEGILSCQLTASFTNTELPQIMEVIAISFGLELQKEDSTYSFNGKGCLDEEVN